MKASYLHNNIIKPSRSTFPLFSSMIKAMNKDWAIASAEI